MTIQIPDFLSSIQMPFEYQSIFIPDLSGIQMVTLFQWFGFQMLFLSTIRIPENIACSSDDYKKSRPKNMNK